MKTTSCPHCGYDNRASAHRCGLCGKPFIESMKTPALAAATTSSRYIEELGEAIPIRRDFAAEIRSNQISSGFLLLLVAGLLAAVGWAFGELFFDPLIGAAIGLAAALIVILWSFYSGDKAVLGVSGARDADASADRRLINLVEEMAIASGLPKPRVMVIESSAMNAFATGRSPDHAAIAVTSGLLERLNREELQGVVAHEMSHIRNLDIRYMMLVAALVGAIVLLSDAGTRGAYWGGGRRTLREGAKGGHPVLAILAMLVIILAPLFATLLQMAISRKREFLADSSAVELTRNPLALASALEKIDLAVGDDYLPGASKATQHLYIVNPLRRYGMRASAILSTHPPMEARIRLLRSMA